MKTLLPKGRTKAVSSLTFTKAPPAGASIEIWDPDTKTVLAFAIIPGGSGTAMSIGTTLTLNQNVQLRLTGVLADFSVSTSFIDKTTREEVSLVKSAALSFPNFQRLILTTSESTLRSFVDVATITFTSALPAGARVEVHVLRYPCFDSLRRRPKTSSPPYSFRYQEMKASIAIQDGRLLAGDFRSLRSKPHNHYQLSCDIGIHVCGPRPSPIFVGKSHGNRFSTESIWFRHGVRGVSQGMELIAPGRLWHLLGTFCSQ